jgi:hypothetical protein
MSIGDERAGPAKSLANNDPANAVGECAMTVLHVSLIAPDLVWVKRHNRIFILETFCVHRLKG